MDADIAISAPNDSVNDGVSGERALWLSAIAAWLGQRLLVVALVIFGLTLSGRLSQSNFSLIWVANDGQWYMSVARDGYQTIGQAAYFPLYPLIMRLSAPLFAGDIALAGIVVSNICSLGAFILLGRLVADEFGSLIARRVLLYYAVVPTGYFLLAGYTEGLFLLLSVATFLCVRRRRWLLAGLLITLATLTRAPGVLLVVPLCIEAWRALWPFWLTSGTRWRIRVALELTCALAAPALALLGFQMYLAAVYGIPDVMSRALALPQWRRSLDWPWTGLTIDIRALAHLSGGAFPRQYLGIAVVDIACLALWLGLSMVMLTPARLLITRALPRSWVAYGWAALLQTLILPSHVPGAGLMSLPRYMMAVFPCLALLALLGARFRAAHRIVFSASVAFTIFLTALVAMGGFVA
jgi:hypothetical protein